jgi:hypothetical protein
MAETPPFPAPLIVSVEVAERRAAVRYPSQSATACHPIPDGDAVCSARVVDISTTGVGLVVDRFIEPETLLAIELPSDGPMPAYTLLVEVRHATARSDGEWRLGCSFARELNEDELRSLL